ncbi:MAG: gamma-glutamyltransferase [Myxococcales bacterium FL481]|nr:MAG: gamma-glutamyltransferase [Myxococcales bacterium FL481]
MSTLLSIPCPLPRRPLAKRTDPSGGVRLAALGAARRGRDLRRPWLALWLSLGLAAGGCGSAQPAPAPVVPAPTADAPSVAAATEPAQPPPRALPSGPARPGVAVGVSGAVASAEAAATDVGLAVLRDGGNAVDAAVAVGFALSVTHPSAGNIGGGGFMVLRTGDGRATAIDYRETAPGAAHRDMYLDGQGNVTDRSRVGALAAGIPGNVAGFALAHEKYGSLPWSRLVEPAVALARDGHILDEFHAEDLRWGSERMDKVGHRQAAAAFRRADGSSLEPGDRWFQPELAASLQLIAQHGPDGFYRGALAQRMVDGVRGLGGIWSIQDLEQYRAVEREPLRFAYRDHEVIAMPPPSAGGVVLRQILAASETLGLHRYEWQAPQQVHLYVETLRRTYADRNLLIGDPDFISIPMAELLDVSYITERLSDIDPARATPSSTIGAGAGSRESEQTTHFSVVDANGMAVANTYTLNGGFGAKQVIPGTGVILNNEMDDFTAKPGEPNMFGLVQGPQNAIAPHKRMLSSMTPTILVKNGELRAIVGSPGGPTITTTVAQIVLQLVDHGHDLPTAVASPRIHHQWLPDAVYHEAALRPDLAAQLRARGHELRERSRIGHVNAIEVDPQSRGFRAVADVERDGGKAAAY